MLPAKLGKKREERAKKLHISKNFHQSYRVQKLFVWRFWLDFEADINANLVPKHFPFLCLQIGFQPWSLSILWFVRWLGLCFAFNLSFCRIFFPFWKQPFQFLPQLLGVSLEHSEPTFSPSLTSSFEISFWCTELPELLRGFSICFPHALHILEHIARCVWFITDT